MKIIYAPHKDTEPPVLPRIFLAGTIDMGNSIDWQNKLAHELKAAAVVLLNPRRQKWQQGWKSTATHLHPELKKQINWELDHLETADVIAVWIEPESFSPVTLMEMGLHMRANKLIIGCPKVYRRAANVYVTAKKYGMKVYPTWKQFVAGVKKYLKKK